MINFCDFHIINKYNPPSLIAKIWLDYNGYSHRDYDLPAEIYNSGTKFWCKHGKFHRVNPQTNELDKNYPAIIYSNGTKEYWEDDIRYILKDDIRYIWKDDRWIEYKI